SDWYDLADDDGLLMQLGARYDCTALIARDPWYEALPLRGMVRVRGAEGGALRTFIGRRERERFVRAVRSREAALVTRFERAGWRVGILPEADGASALFETFGAHGTRAR
ncbi:MAG TPA: hypothetical protein VGN11_13005, partial [Candidatus Baltobacteraceae bacterium]|nr:hypothetical protein [Candidatus Baltobacteraceae bacterium]